MSAPRFVVAMLMSLVLSGATAQGADDEPKTQDKDIYAVPEKATVRELIEKFRELRAIRPTEQEEAIAHGRKLIPAIKQIGDRIRDIATAEDKQLDDLDTIVGMWWQIRARELPQMPLAKRKEFLDELKTELTSTPTPDKQLASAALTAASGFERKDPAEAARLYREFGPIVAKVNDPAVANYGARMEGAARRLELVGNPLELEGTLVDGSPFNWSSYRGKVVLVDFWATWCGPCMAELPNVKKNYEMYHDRGFDVVGISLDDDRAALEQFLEKEKNPWPTVYDGGWNQNAVATYYGIMGIPTVILVDKEGKVVSTKARGPELGKLLASLLGPTEESEKGETSSKTEDK